MHPDLIARIRRAMTSSEGSTALLTLVSELEKQDISGVRLNIEVSTPARPRMFIPTPIGTLFGTIDIEAVERGDD